jgi:hypothetical protein
MERLGQRRGQPHGLDAEAGFDGLDPVAQQAREPLHVPRRGRRPDPYRPNPVVDPAEQQIQPARAQPPLLERGAEQDHQLAQIAVDGLRRGDRFGEDAPDFDDVRRPDRLDRFGSPAERLIEPPADERTEPQRQRRSRGRLQIADTVESELAEPGDHVRIEAQRPNRYPGQDLGRPACWKDAPLVGGNARQRVGCAPRVRDGEPCPHPGCSEASGDVGKHGFFASMEMIGTGGVEDQSVGRIGRCDG